MELELGKQIIFYPSQNTLKMNEDLNICAGDTNINWDCPRQTGCISPLSVKKRQNSRMIQVFSFNHWMGMLDILKGEGLEERWVEVA